MGEFDFLGDSGTGGRRSVVYQKRRSSGCLPVLQVALGILLAVAVMFGGCVFIVGMGAKQLAEQQKKSGRSMMKDIQKDVANDAIRQYNTVIDNDGSDVDAYVRAGMVAESFLQAGDDANYRKWKKIADAHAKNAGMVIP